MQYNLIKKWLWVKVVIIKCKQFTCGNNFHIHVRGKYIKSTTTNKKLIIIIKGKGC